MQVGDGEPAPEAGDEAEKPLVPVIHECVAENLERVEELRRPCGMGGSAREAEGGEDANGEDGEAEFRDMGGAIRFQSESGEGRRVRLPGTFRC